MTSLDELLQDVPNLVSLPHVALRIDKVLADENASLNDAARIIEADPALTSKLLQVANSALFGGGGDIDTLNRAIARVGTRQARQIVMGLELASSFAGLPSELISVEDFWRHSLYCATLCRLVADHVKLPGRDAAFTAGLLHDIGQLVLFIRCPEESRQALWRSLDESDGRETFAAEFAEFGFDHTDVGLAVARLWGFPDILQRCIYGHHHPDRIDNAPPLVYLVHLANSLAVLVELETDDWSSAPPVAPETWTVLGIQADALGHFLTSAKEDTQELLALFTQQ